MELSGKNIGKYNVIRKLGGGGMGNVYLAKDTILDRMVAIKFLAPSLAADASFVERFRLEARALARLDHPAIVRVYNADWFENQLFLAMEYVEAGSLGDIIKREGLQSPEWSLKALKDVAEGLDYAHRFGLVHRDIKPANILLDLIGQAQITDFGLVKDVEVSLTADGQRLGTPAYMAPEQIQGKDMGPAVDIYALGIVAFELFAGEPPFRGTISAVFEGHLLRQPPLIRQYNPGIPSTVQDVVGRALSKSPQDRYPSAAEFVSALSSAFEQANRQSATLLDLEAELPNAPSQFVTMAEPPPASPAVSRSAVAGPKPTAAPSNHPARTPAVTNPPLAPSNRSEGQVPPKRTDSRSRFGFGALGIGSFAVIGLICICSVIGLITYGDGFSSLFNTPQSDPLGPTTLFETNFNVQPDNGFPTEVRPEGDLSYAQGGYLISIDAPEWIFWGLSERSFGDTTLEVDINNQSSVFASEFGAVCRYTNDNDFYFGFLSSDGLYGIVHSSFGNFDLLTEVPVAPHGAIRQGNSSNRLRLDCEGSSIRLWANDTFLTQTFNVPTLTGDIGVIASAPIQGGVDILFDNLLVTEARGQ